MAEYRRSIFLINRPFQLRFSFFVCSWLFALSLVYPYIIYSLFDYFVRYVALDPMGPELSQLFDTRKQMLYLLASLQALFLVVTFLVSIFISHRIAGPLYKLQRFFEQGRDGRLDQILFFRKHDHFKELADGFNDLTGAVRKSHEQATAAIERALPKANAEVKAELEAALTALQTIRVQPSSSQQNPEG